MTQVSPLSISHTPFAIMGILNVTPDSFYDGGLHASVDCAVEHGVRLAAEGADLLDVGGESTRPGSLAVTEEDEVGRVIPVIQRLVKSVSVPISVDTTKASVAQRALDAGATWINDISAGRFDPDMPRIAALGGCPVVLMHSRGTPQTMQQDPHYDDVMGEVRGELRRQVDAFLQAGVQRDRIVLDPGIGFSKRLEHNLELLQRLDELVALGFRVLVGTSRKSFVGRLTGKDVDGRLAGSLGSVAVAYGKGARIFRVHDVDATKDMLTVIHGIAECGMKDSDVSRGVSP